MKKSIKLTSILLIALFFSSCATILGGKVTEYQKTKPVPGEQQRDIRLVALIADIILFWPGAVVDFATGAIYKPASE
ncbi:hypothetical protein N9H57_05460 [Flavobacteriaceae bacterium]|nr:hypothetical protein [Flavobacteriaceae bacterium]